jgi:hypothetical protein
MRGPARMADLRDGMVPGALAGTAHDEQVPSPGQVRDARSTALRAQPERTRLTEGDQRHRRLRQLPGDAVTVPGDAVGAVAVEVRADLRELHAVARRQDLGHLDEDPRWVVVALADHPPAGEARLGQRALVHPAAVLGPRGRIEQLREQPVRSPHPAGLVVDPGAFAEVAPDDLREGVVEPHGSTCSAARGVRRGTIVHRVTLVRRAIEQRGLPGQIRHEPRVRPTAPDPGTAMPCRAPPPLRHAPPPPCRKHGTRGSAGSVVIATTPATPGAPPRGASAQREITHRWRSVAPSRLATVDVPAPPAASVRTWSSSAPG